MVKTVMVLQPYVGFKWTIDQFYNTRDLKYMAMLAEAIKHRKARDCLHEFAECPGFAKVFYGDDGILDFNGRDLDVGLSWYDNHLIIVSQWADKVDSNVGLSWFIDSLFGWCDDYAVGVITSEKEVVHYTDIGVSNPCQLLYQHITGITI